VVDESADLCVICADGDELGRVMMCGLRRASVPDAKIRAAGGGGGGVYSSVLVGPENDAASEETVMVTRGTAIVSAGEVLQLRGLKDSGRAGGDRRAAAAVCAGGGGSQALSKSEGFF